MKDWDDIANELEKGFGAFASEPYGDVLLNPARAALIVTRVFKEKEEYYSMESSAKKFINNLKRNVEENPVMVFLAAAAVMTATAKLINAVGHARGSSAYAKQVHYRINKGK